MSTKLAHIGGSKGGPRRSFDVESVRLDFPGLHQDVHGQPLTYLDNAATTQKPRAVIDAMSRFYERDCSNVHRGVHELSDRATRAFEGARERVRSFLNAASEREIIFVRGTTEATNLVAQSFLRPRLQPGDEILVSEIEHHSNIVPWQIVAEQTGAVVRVIPVNDEGELVMDEADRLLGPKTRLLAIVHVSNAIGTVNPIAELVEMAHARGVPVLVDGAQALSHLRVDVQALGADFYAFSGHKLYGPTGIGALYGRQELLEAMPPWMGGGDMISSVSFERTTWNRLPYKFEAGTPNIAGAVGLGAALEYLDALGLDAIAAHESTLLEEATRVATSISGLRVIGTAQRKAPVLSFVIDGVHPHDIGTILDRRGIAIRTGHHCAEPAMRRFGVPATARASFGLYNTASDIAVLEKGLGEVVKFFGGG